MGYKWCSVCTKGPKVYQKNILTTAPSPAWSVDTRQNGSVFLCFLCHIVTLPSKYRSRNWDSSDRETFYQSWIVTFWWFLMNCGLSFLFLAEWHPVQSSPPIADLLYSHCFKVGCVVHSKMIFCISWTTSCYLSYCCLLSAWSSVAIFVWPLAPPRNF